MLSCLSIPSPIGLPYIWYVSVGLHPSRKFNWTLALSCLLIFQIFQEKGSRRKVLQRYLITLVAKISSSDQSCISNIMKMNEAQ